ncbi:MAG: hypothetical protein ACI4IJ_09275 [Acutalibacteraceae bacterium]|nr:hypothetical protein [Bacillota bacterium]
MAKSLNVDVEKNVEILKNRFPQFEEYKLDFELPANKGKYSALKLQNENPVSFSIYTIISQNDGILLRFGDLMLYCNHPNVDNEFLEKIDLILSDRFIALVNYENILHLKQGIPGFSTYFVMNETGEFDDERRRLRDTLIELKRNHTGLKWLFNKYRGVTVLTNWSGSMFEKFEK